MGTASLDSTKKNRPVRVGAISLSPLLTCPWKLGKEGFWLDGNSTPHVIKYRLSNGTDAAASGPILPAILDVAPRGTIFFDGSGTTTATVDDDKLTFPTSLDRYRYLALRAPAGTYASLRLGLAWRPKTAPTSLTFQVALSVGVQEAVGGKIVAPYNPGYGGSVLVAVTPTMGADIENLLVTVDVTGLVLASDSLIYIGISRDGADPTDTYADSIYVHGISAQLIPA